MTDVNFLKILRQKLKTGNTRSIHLNAQPGRYLTRFDIADLNSISPNHCNEFFNTLLTEPDFKFDISIPNIDNNKLSENEKRKFGLIAKRLNNIQYQNEDNFLEYGIRTFSFGFPILIKRDKQDNKIIKAPLLIWSLDLEKSKKQINKWTISRTEDHPITFNEVLISHIETDENIKLSPLTEGYLEDRIIDKDEFVQICYDLLKQFKVNIKQNSLRNFIELIKKFPDKEEIESIASNIPNIIWSGVFGLYRTQKESIIKDIDKLIEKHEQFEFDKFKIEKYQTSTVASVETDPSQEKILNTISNNSEIIIQGPPGTGKSQSITAIITNALDNGRKCLVVCEKKTAMDVIEKNLKEVGLSELCVIIDDTTKDREKVVESVRNRVDNYQPIVYGFGKNKYTELINKYNNYKKELNQSHLLLDGKLFGDENWTMLVGKLLKKRRNLNKNLLKNKLSSYGFKFIFEEYINYIEIIKNAKRLYSKINPTIPLKEINNKIYTDKNLPQAIDYIENSIQEIINKSEELNKEIDILLNEYHNNLKKHFEFYCNQFLELSKLIKNKIYENKNKYSDIFNAQQLYLKINSSSVSKEINNEIYIGNSPLKEINNKIYIDKNLPQAIDYIENSTQEIINNLEIINKEIELLLNGYHNNLKEHFEIYCNQFLELSKLIKNKIYENKQKYGILFDRYDTFANLRDSILSHFSKNYKIILQEKNNIINQYKKTLELFNAEKYFDFEFFTLTDKFRFEDILKSISNFEIEFKKWMQEKDKLIDEYIQKLSINYIHKEIDFKDKTISMEDKINSIVENTNSKKILSEKTSILPKTIIEKKKNIEFILTKMREISDFNRNYKIIFQEAEEIINQYNKISDLFNAENYFKHNFIDLTNKFKFEDMFNNLTDFEIEFKKWIEGKDKLIDNYVQKLSTKHIHKEIDFKDKTISMEDKINSMIESINSKELLSEKIFISSKTIIEKNNDIKAIITKMKDISNSLGDFHDFYNWKHYYLNLNKQQQKVISLLIEVNHSNWVDVFDIWYFHELLSKNYHEELPKEDSKIIDLFNTLRKLKKYQKDSILYYWRNKQIEYHSNYKEKIEIHSLFNKRGSKGQRRNSLRKIIATDFTLFTDFFPVLLVNPVVCSSIIPLKEGIFDLVIFDEASQLRIEDTYSSLIRGKYKIVSGDIHQMPPSSYFKADINVNPMEEDEEDDTEINPSANKSSLAYNDSLLEYAENSGFKRSYLDAHYRSRHPYLIDFSNHAFYGKRLIPMPEKVKWKPIRFIEVNGIYNDKEHINPQEARKVIEILINEVKPNGNNYPSVGIATFNIYQRNLILDEISKIRENNSEINEKFEKLFESGLFVKNLENIQGDEKDIIIISTTFGKKQDGTFTQNFGPITKKNGYRLLNVIITRAKHMLYVCTSIPQEFYNRYQEELSLKGNDGNAIFYSYLFYAKSIENNNEEIRNSILNVLYKNCSEKPIQIDTLHGVESPFEEEVVQYLTKYIESERIELQHRCGGFRIDIVIKSKNTKKPIIAIECDGAKYHSSNEAYAWDMFRQKNLEDHGFKFYRIWSTNWWLNPEKETEKLVDFIRSMDLSETQKLSKV